jgi:plasmid stability protein
MGAITIRNLPEAVHNQLREMASAGNLSVEALVRNLLAAATAGTAQHASGMSEASAPWAMPPKPASTELWGALPGCVHIPPATDLTAATGEAWDAAS